MSIDQGVLNILRITWNTTYVDQFRASNENHGAVSLGIADSRSCVKRKNWSPKHHNEASSGAGSQKKWSPVGTRSFVIEESASDRGWWGGSGERGEEYRGTMKKRWRWWRKRWLRRGAKECMGTRRKRTDRDLPVPHSSNAKASSESRGHRPRLTPWNYKTIRSTPYNTHARAILCAGALGLMLGVLDESICSIGTSIHDTWPLQLNNISHG